MEYYTICEAKEEMKRGFQMYMQKDEEGRYLIPAERQIPYFLIGPAGVGKTGVCGQAAEELGVGFVSMSMVHHTRQSALGLPEIRSLKLFGRELKYTQYTISEIIAEVLKKVEEGKEQGILLLDEYNCISDTLMPASLAFLQSKVFGNTKLPEGWMIVIAGNPPKSIYNKNAKAFDVVIMDRLRLINIRQDSQSFLTYAKGKKMHEMVILYLQMYPDDTYVCEKQDGEQTIVTCRSWENLSCVLQNYEKLGFPVDEKLIAQYLKGNRIVQSFFVFYRQREEMQNLSVLDDILAGSLQKTAIRKIQKFEFTAKMAVSQAAWMRVEKKMRQVFGKHTVLEQISCVMEQMDRESGRTGIIELMKKTEKTLDESCRGEFREICSIFLDNELQMLEGEENSGQIMKTIYEEQMKQFVELREQAGREYQNFMLFIREILMEKGLYAFYKDMTSREEAFIYTIYGSSVKEWYIQMEEEDAA